MDIALIMSGQNSPSSNPTDLRVIVEADLLEDIPGEGDGLLQHVLHLGGEALEEETQTATAGHGPHLRGNRMDGIVAHGTQQ